MEECKTDSQRTTLIAFETNLIEKSNELTEVTQLNNIIDQMEQPTPHITKQITKRKCTKRRLKNNNNKNTTKNIKIPARAKENSDEIWFDCIESDNEKNGSWNESENYCEITHASPIYQLKSDDRPHILVTIKEKQHKALIDSGSQVTVISKSWIKRKEDWGKPMDRLMQITTVDSTAHRKNEMIEIEFTFQNLTKKIPTVILD